MYLVFSSVRKRLNTLPDPLISGIYRSNTIKSGSRTLHAASAFEAIAGGINRIAILFEQLRKRSCIVLLIINN